MKDPCKLFNRLLPKRVDGEESRKRIMTTALKLFAAQGYAKTSTRQIAKDANVNISAISYYFGDKAGLYRATLFPESMPNPTCGFAYDDETLSLEQALNQLFFGYIEPLKQGEPMRMRIRLVMREMIEPTGLWEALVDSNLVPKHQALLKVLQKHLKLQEVDDDLQRLARCIVAMGVHLCMGHDGIKRISPSLVADNAALDVMHARMTMFAMSMVDAEVARRKELK